MRWHRLAYTHIIPSRTSSWGTQSRDLFSLGAATKGLPRSVYSIWPWPWNAVAVLRLLLLLILRLHPIWHTFSGNWGKVGNGNRTEILLELPGQGLCTPVYSMTSLASSFIRADTPTTRTATTTATARTINEQWLIDRFECWPETIRTAQSN